MNDTKQNVIKYLVTCGVGFFGVAIVLYLRGYDFSMPLVEQYKILSDAFMVPGAILACSSILAWVASEGTFDMISYGLRRGASSLIPFARHNDETFYDYKVKKKAKREGRSAWFLLFVGLGFLLVMLVFNILYSTVQ